MKIVLPKLFKKEKKGKWNEDGQTRRRVYETYESYVEHQKSKLAQIGNIERKSRILTEALRGRLGKIDGIGRGSSVLCLGARTGDECKVLIELGALAVGIDLNPGIGNLHVMHGDFHRLQFADHSVQNIYTNCLEHAYELEAVIREVKRVLQPGGLFIAEIVLGSKDVEGRDPGEHDSIWWDHADTVVTKIESAGFTIRSRLRFDKPWNGTQVVFVST